MGQLIIASIFLTFFMASSVTFGQTPPNPPASGGNQSDNLDWRSIMEAIDEILGEIDQAVTDHNEKDFKSAVTNLEVNMRNFKQSLKGYGGNKADDEAIAGYFRGWEEQIERLKQHGLAAATSCLDKIRDIESAAHDKFR